MVPVLDVAVKDNDSVGVVASVSKPSTQNKMNGFFVKVVVELLCSVFVGPRQGKLRCAPTQLR